MINILLIHVHLVRHKRPYQVYQNYFPNILWAFYAARVLSLSADAYDDQASEVVSAMVSSAVVSTSSAVSAAACSARSTLISSSSTGVSSTFLFTTVFLVPEISAARSLRSAAVFLTRYSIRDSLEATQSINLISASSGVIAPLLTPRWRCL